MPEIMEYVWAIQHQPPKEVSAAHRIILWEVYSADDASRRIPVLISRLEYRRREAVLSERADASS